MRPAAQDSGIERKTVSASTGATGAQRRDVLTRFIAVFAPTVAVLAGILFLIYRLDLRTTRAALQANAQHAVELQGRVIDARLGSVISDLLVLAEHHELHLLLESMSTDHLVPLAREFQSFATIKRTYDQVRFLDADGMERVRANRTAAGAEIVPAGRLQDKSDRYYFLDAIRLGDRQVFVSPFDLNVEDGRIEVPHKPMLRFATPVFDLHGRKGGIVVLNYLGDDLLGDMDSSDDVGDMALLNRDGYWLKSPHPEDEWGFMLEGRQNRRFDLDHPEAWSDISAGETGQFRTSGGLFTFSTVHPASHELASLGGVTAGGFWKIVCHIPAPVIDARERHLADSLLLLGSLLLVLAAAGAWVVALGAARRKWYEEALRSARDAAIEASRVKSDFLANMSHEIRTPLNGIVGMTELLLTTQLNRIQRNYLEAVDTSAESLMAILNDLLDLSKIEAGKMSLEPIQFLLSEALKGVLEIMAIRAHEKKLELACEIDPDVPDDLVGDPGRLRQIIINLVGNAVKFTEVGEVVVRVTCQHRDEDGVELAVTVSDTGIGVPPGRQQAIFESFSQADTSTTRRFGGTGLGLTISSQLVGMMGGRIWLESEEGVGSDFKFTARLGLPANPLPARQVALPEDVVGMRALAVDDNATNRRILEDTLKGWGMVPTVVESGGVALEVALQAAASGAPFEIMLLDLMMPGMDGLEVAGRIQQEGALGGAIVMLLTSSDDESEIARMEGAGVRTYMRKPITQSRLLASILEVIPSREGSANGEPEGSPPEVPTPVSLRVLLAEDNKINQAVAMGMLEKQGHRATTVVDGREALQALRDEHYDVVLMDVQMPEMGGLEATEAIRARETETGGHIPIVGLTANAMKSDEEACLAAGMDSYIAKPLRSQRLADTLASLGILAAGVGPEGPSSTEADLDQLPVLDSSTLEELRELEQEGAFSLREVVEIFDTEADPRLAALRTAFEGGNGGDLKLEAHTLKGSARDLGALRLAAICQEVEDCGAASRFEGVAELMDRVAAELSTARAELKELLRQG